jgi:long-chain acyl-CoA synthetase
MSMTRTPAVERFFARLESFRSAPALYWRGEEQSYEQLLESTYRWEDQFKRLGIHRGTVVSYIGDYWPEVVSFTLAIIRAGAIAVPYSVGAEREVTRLDEVATSELFIRFDGDGAWTEERRNQPDTHPVVERFRAESHPGCIVFSSGSTGEPKAILHDFEKLLQKFEKKRNSYRTLLFLLMDHLGGINTLLAVLSNGGMGATAEMRTAEKVANVIEAAGIELLPVTPAFLTLLMTSGAPDAFDLSSLRLITYGTDAMPESVLRAAVERFPDVRLQQTYGLSEVGVLRSKSKASASLMVRVGGEGFETRIVDGVLHVRSESAMFGYLNAPDPFDDEGWLNTGDLVEVEGDYLRILGRESEIINVGGQKVFPAEVESVLLQAPNILDATVFPEAHPLLGRVVSARVRTETDEDPMALRRRLRAFCLENLAPFKVPARIRASSLLQHNERFKKVRRGEGGQA